MKKENIKKEFENEIDAYSKLNDNNENYSKEAEVGEDTTKYGEFISSYFAWIPLPEQKEKAKKMENITKTSKKKENKKNSEKNIE